VSEYHLLWAVLCRLEHKEISCLNVKVARFPKPNKASSQVSATIRAQVSTFRFRMSEPATLAEMVTYNDTQNLGSTTDDMDR
jgi:hypothetical protein